MTTQEAGKAELVDAGDRAGPGRQGDRRADRTTWSASCSAPTTGTSRPRTCSTAATPTSTARSPRTTSWPRNRPAGHRPGAGAHARRWARTAGPRAGTRVVEVVVDDMPFLVDSLTMELSRQMRDVHVVIHPSFDVVRDITGELQSIAAVADGALEPEGEAVRESWMHVEIDRLPEGDDPDEIIEDAPAGAPRRPRVRRGLAQDARAGRGDRRRGCAADPPPLDARGGAPGRRAAGVAGRRPLHLPRLQGVPARARGRGRVPARRPRHRARHPARRPGDVGVLRPAARRRSRPRPARRRLLVLAKANSRATVHRPAYLDYVGVKTFDENGEVDGERRFLGLFSSAAYTESLMRIPLIREKAAAVLKRSGFDPRSHAGKALMDTLETYPRDELFHTPVDELAPMAEAAMSARERRAVKMFIRRDTYGRYVSVLVYLPRDRYNTSVREKFARILKERLNGESVEFTVRINESTTARVHFVVHLPKGPTASGLPDVDTADLERRLTEASRSWRDDFLGAVVAEYGEEVGTILGRRYADSFPEAYKEDFTARTAAVDLGRLEAIIRRRGARPLALRETSTPARARRGSRSSGSARRCRCPQVLPMLSSMGVEVVDERPYELEGLERRSMIYEFGLRYGAHLPSGSRELFQDALRAVWDGYNEIDGFNALVLGGRADLAAGHRAAGLREVHAPGQQPVRAGLHRGRAARQRRHHPAAGRALRGPVRPRPAPTRPRRSGSSSGSSRSLDDVASLDHDRILRSYLHLMLATLRTNYFQATRDGGPHAYMSFKLEPSAIPDLPAAAAEVRDLRLLAARRGRAPALRPGGPRRPALVGPARRLPHRGARPGQGADGEEHRDRAGAARRAASSASSCPTRSDRDAWLAEGVACYTTFICGLLDITDNLVDGETVPPRGRRAPRRRRLLPGRRRRQGHRDVLRHRQRGRPGLRVLARRRVRQRRLGRLRPQGDGHHRARRLGLGAAALPRAGHRLPDRGLHRVGIGDMSGDVFGNGMLLLRAHQAGGRLRPPRHLPRPRPRPGDVVRRAQAALRAAAVELAGLRHGADLRGRRRLPALVEVDPAQRRGARRARHRRRRRPR